MKDEDTILIVDDEPVIHKILEGLLFNQGYKLAFANNGLEALEKVTEISPDLILLDVMMPQMTGFEVCRRLKADEKWQHMPIILVTALDSKEDLAHGLDAGADDFLPKPFDNIELVARVRSMLRIKKQYDLLAAQRQQLEEALHLKEQFVQVTTHHLQELEILHDVGLRLVNNLDTDSVLSLIAEVALQIIPAARRCVMHLLSDREQQLLPIVFVPEDNSKMVYPSLGIEELVKQTIRTQEAINVPNLSIALPHTQLQSDDMQALLVAPLLSDQQAIGTLSVLSSEVDVFTERHLHILSILANQAAVAIVKARFFEKKVRTKEIEKHAIRDLFQRYVSPMVVERLVDGRENLALGGQRHKISALFADIRGFTAFSENLRPESVIEVLNDYLALAVDAILAEEGTLDKFMGDAVMAIFNAPLPQPDYTLRAVRAALAMQRAIADYNVAVGNHRPLSFGIGIHFGPAVVGNIGTTQQMNYTAIGDTVNLAKRLQEKAEKGQILLSQAAYDAVKGHVIVEDLGLSGVKGRAATVHTYALIDLI
jgi:class 3 adenylate cyclase/DNA-binding NarL/FixJ family response regulator